MNIKYALYMLLVCTTSFSFEYNEDFDQPIIIGLDDKMAQQELIKTIVAKSSNIPTAVEAFNSHFSNLLAANSKQINVKTIVFNFLRLLSQKFPGQEVRIAKLLDTSFGYDWLAIKKPLYKTNATSSPGDGSRAMQYVMTKNYDNLRKWLDQGNDANRVLKFALINKNLYALKMAIAYGADINILNLFYDHGTNGTPLDYVILKLEQQKTKDANSASAAFPQLQPLYDYLVSEGARTKDSL
ncbi:hypothetical protein Noda2021_10920 [Candidatus Dependentiae bacterium Noda2021]|nr:hypothetical protein Noda2021_10920 [Candidatus Dependentiae bacterium Noda2021]